MNLTLRIWRQHDTDAAGRFVTYQVDGVTPDMRLMRPDFPYFGEPHPNAASAAKP